jgi:hypothetical protein
LKFFTDYLALKEVKKNHYICIVLKKTKIMELTKKVTLGGKPYLLQFPVTIGEHLEIGLKKTDYSKGRYWDILKIETDMALYQFGVINCASILDVIAPKMVEDFGDGVKSVMEYPPKKLKIITDLFFKDIANWFQEQEKIVFDATEEEEGVNED